MVRAKYSAQSELKALPLVTSPAVCKVLIAERSRIVMA